MRSPLCDAFYSHRIVASKDSLPLLKISNEEGNSHHLRTQRQTYTGELSPSAGMGHPSVWHLLIDNHFYGTLVHTQQGWTFHSEWMPEMADVFGEYIIAWYE